MLKPSEGFFFWFQRLSTSGIYAKARRICRYTTLLDRWIFIHNIFFGRFSIMLLLVFTEIGEVCKRKYCLDGLRFSRTFWGPKTGSFKLGTKKWLSTELNHILKNWRKIKHLRGNKNSELPEYSIFHKDCLKKNRFWRSLGMRRSGITLPRSDAACCQSEKWEYWVKTSYFWHLGRTQMTHLIKKLPLWQQQPIAMR